MREALVVVGIDPGKEGGLVGLTARGGFVCGFRSERTVLDAERHYLPARMAEVLREIAPALVVLERQHAMPDMVKRKGEAEGRKQGNSSTFQTGYGYGLWHGVIAACGLPLELVTVGRWRKVVLVGVPGEDEKQRAVQVVSNRVPGLVLVPPRGSKPHVGLAEAACIALYGLTRLGHAVPPPTPEEKAHGDEGQP